MRYRRWGIGPRSCLTKGYYRQCQQLEKNTNWMLAICRGFFVALRFPRVGGRLLINRELEESPSGMPEIVRGVFIRKDSKNSNQDWLLFFLNQLNKVLKVLILQSFWSATCWSCYVSWCVYPFMKLLLKGFDEWNIIMYPCHQRLQDQRSPAKIGKN